METHVLVTTDGFDPAQAAVNVAVDLAAKFDVPLTNGHVMQFDRPTDEPMPRARAEHPADRSSTWRTRSGPA